MCRSIDTMLVVLVCVPNRHNEILLAHQTSVGLPVPRRVNMVTLSASSSCLPKVYWAIEHRETEPAAVKELAIARLTKQFACVDEDHVWFCVLR